MGAYHYILDRRHVHAHLQILKGAAHATACELERCPATDLLAIKFDFSARWRVDAGNEIEQCGLACTVRANDRMNRAPPNGEAHVLDRTYPTELLGQTLHHELT